MGKLTHTVKGPIASFRSADKASIESLKIHFLPKQEGSEDPSPSNVRPITGWTGLNVWHGVKNQLIPSPRTDTNLGVTWVVDSNGKVTFAGTPTSWSSVIVGEVYLDESMILSAKIYGGEDYVVLNDLYLYDSSNTRVAIVQSRWNGQNEATIDLSEYTTAVKARILIKRKTNDVPMYGCCYVVAGQINNENIPITFPISGKNIFDVGTYPFTTGYWVGGNSGALSTNNAYKVTISYIPIERFAGKKITLNKRPGGANPGIAFYSDALETTFISGVKNNNVQAGTPITVTVPLNAKYMRFTVPADATDIQIELGETATSYEPYSSDNTFYGGYIDLITGEVWRTYGSIDLGTINYTYASNLGGGAFTGSLPRGNETAKSKWSGFCNKYKVVNGYNGLTNVPQGVGYVYYYDIIVKDTNVTLDDPDLIKAAMNGVMLYYELGEPVLVGVIAPTEIKAYLDYNNFWSDANDDIEVEYCFVDRLSKRKLDLNEPHIESKTGSIVSFNTDIRSLLPKLKFNFLPIQEGSGNPYPPKGSAQIWDEEWETGYYDTNGEKTANASMFRCKNRIPVTPNTTYAFVGKQSSQVGWRRYDANGDYIGMSCNSNGSSTAQTYGFSFTTDANTHFMVFFINDSNTYANDISFNYPVTDTTYHKYSNVRPITGWTGLNWKRVDKNLTTIQQIVDGRPYESLTYENRQCILVPASGATPISMKGAFKENTRYTMAFDAKYMKKASAQSDPTSPFRITVVYTDDTTTPFDVHPQYINEWHHYVLTSKAGKTIDHLLLGSYEFRAEVYFDVNTFMLAEGDTESTYEPYKGTSFPISFPVTGKNIFDINQLWDNGIDHGTTEIVRYYKMTVPNGKYTISTNVINNTNSSIASIFATNELVTPTSSYDGVFLNTPKTITISNNELYIFIRTTSAGGYLTWNKTSFSDYYIQVEAGQTATTYEPFGNIYGGYIDLVAGEIVIEYGKISMKYWKSWYRYTNNQFCINTNKKKSSDKLFCDTLPISKTNAFPTDDKSVGFYSNGASYANIVFIKYTDSDNINDFNTWLNSLDGDPCFVYELETPIHISITPQQLKAFKGLNNIWSDTNGNVEIKYWTH